MATRQPVEPWATPRKPTRQEAIQAFARILVAIRADLMRDALAARGGQARSTPATGTEEKVTDRAILGLMPPLLIDAHEVAEMTGFSVPTILKMSRQGRIPARKVGRLTRFVRSEIEDWIARLPPANG